MELYKLGIGHGNNQVEATLLYMKQLIIKSDTEDKERIIKETAKNAVAHVNPSDHLGQVKAIVAHVRKTLPYVRDIHAVEELTSPYRIAYNIREGRNTHSSDCDDHAIYIAALLRVIGFRTRLEALSVQGRNYDHARVSVLLGGKWVVIEGTKRAFPVGQALPSKLPIMAVEVV